MINRRSALLTVLTLAACATEPTPIPEEPPAAAGFQSDRISVVVRGEGPDVILIPGLTSHRDVWGATAHLLEDTHRLHLVQVNGFAGFPAGANAEGPVSAPVAEEIARYIAENNLQRPAIIGHSMGGTIGLMLAARHPDSVGRLMVVDMFPFMGVMFGGAGATPESLRPIAEQIRQQMLAGATPPGMPSLEQMIANMTNTENMRPTLVQHSRNSNRATVANAFAELIVTDLRPELVNIQVPLWVLYVIPPDLPLPPEQYDQFFRLSYANAPQARVIKIEESRHFIMIDQAERFIREAEAFLAR